MTMPTRHPKDATRAQLAAYWGFGIGFALTAVGIALPPAGVVGVLLAAGSVVAMLVQLPARLRAHRAPIRPVITCPPTPIGPQASTGTCSADADPDVITQNHANGLATWTCACGSVSSGGYLDPAFARKAFLKHKYGGTWPNP